MSQKDEQFCFVLFVLRISYNCYCGDISKMISKLHKAEMFMSFRYLISTQIWQLMYNIKIDIFARTMSETQYR